MEQYVSLDEYSKSGGNGTTRRSNTLINASLYIQDPFDYTLHNMAYISEMFPLFIRWMQVKGTNPPLLKETVRWRLFCFGLYAQRLPLCGGQPSTVTVENPGLAATF